MISMPWLASSMLWINVLVFSLPVSVHKVHLFALPARFGGLGISDPDHPVESAVMAFHPAVRVLLY